MDVNDFTPLGLSVVTVTVRVRVQIRPRLREHMFIVVVTEIDLVTLRHSPYVSTHYWPWPDSYS